MRHETRCEVPFTRVLTVLTVVLAVITFGIGVAGAEETGASGKTAAPPEQPAAPASAQNAPATPAQVPAAEAADQAGMRAFIDPATGQLREPTPEEAAALTRFMVRALAMPTAPQVVRHPNGMLSAQLGEEYMNDVVVRKNPDGTLSWVCVPRSLSETVLNTPAPPKSPELEKE
jgi:hypothetical protein